MSQPFDIKAGDFSEDDFPEIAAASDGIAILYNDGVWGPAPVTDGRLRSLATAFDDNSSAKAKSSIPVSRLDVRAFVDGAFEGMKSSRPAVQRRLQSVSFSPVIEIDFFNSGDVADGDTFRIRYEDL